MIKGRRALHLLNVQYFPVLLTLQKELVGQHLFLYIAFEVVLRAPSGLLFELLCFDKCFDMRWVSYSDCMIVCWVLMRPKHSVIRSLVLFRGQVWYKPTAFLICGAGPVCVSSEYAYIEYI